MVTPSPDRISAGGGLQAFSVPVPLTGITFPTVSCDAGGGLIGTQLGPAEVTLLFRNISTNCTVASTIVVTPPASLPNPCTPRPPQAAVTTPPSGTCLDFGDVSVAGGPVTLNIRVRNNASAGSASLVVSTATSNDPEFDPDETGLPATATPGTTITIPVSFDPVAVGQQEAIIQITTNDPVQPTIEVCVRGNGIP